MNNIKILHLASNEKFIDMAMDSFERVFPGKNDLWVYSRSGENCIKKTSFKKIRIIDLLFGKIDKRMNEYDIIIFHSLISGFSRMLKKIDFNKKIIWIGWGYDYYNFLFSNNTEMLLFLTENLYKKNRFCIKKIFKNIASFVLKNFFFLNNISPDEKLARIDYFAPVLPNEYDIVFRSRTWKKFPKKAFWNYGNLEDHFIKGFSDCQVEGDAILIGNSSSYTNNHLDTFHLLKSIGLNYRKLIVPLSYGDMAYRDIVLKNGYALFGNNFNPLLDFVPIEDYVKMIKSCGFVIMNHVRQQAVGNIVIMLYLGAKVFLRVENPVYQFFKYEGAIVYSIQDLEKDVELLKGKMALHQIEKNREVVKRHWSRDVSDYKTKKMIETVLSDSA